MLAYTIRCRTSMYNIHEQGFSAVPAPTLQWPRGNQVILATQSSLASVAAGSTSPIYLGSQLIYLARVRLRQRSIPVILLYVRCATFRGLGSHSFNGQNLSFSAKTGETCSTSTVISPIRACNPGRHFVCI